ncbi:hypothetical protein [Streptomyces sp. CC208A]|uniref:hypothetical protein n=1 Tax=Streptomyces sp. CC208A TaxID=3044573 RepID=UPI0024A99168|nr:hypothetical protein [Streptomyces sp. CC208A]
MNTALSLAGVALAAAIVWANIRPWWKGGRDPKALLPFGSAWLLGVLATMCVGGLLGWGASGIAGLITTGGNAAVDAAAGTGDTTFAGARLGALTPEGGTVVTLYTIGIGIAWKAAGKQDKRRMLGGLATGAALGFLPGVVLLLDWLPDSVNGVGAYAKALAQGQAAL